MGNMREATPLESPSHFLRLGQACSEEDLDVCRISAILSTTMYCKQRTYGEFLIMGLLFGVKTLYVVCKNIESYRPIIGQGETR